MSKNNLLPVLFIMLAIIFFISGCNIPNTKAENRNPSTVVQHTGKRTMVRYRSHDRIHIRLVVLNEDGTKAGLLRTNEDLYIISVAFNKFTDKGGINLGDRWWGKTDSFPCPISTTCWVALTHPSGRPNVYLEHWEKLKRNYPALSQTLKALSDNSLE